MLQARSCCCGCSLTTGVRIIGYVQLTITGGLVFLSIIAAIVAMFNIAVYYGTDHVMVVSVVIILKFTFPFVFGVLLVVGVEQNRPGFLMAWMINAWLEVILLVVCIILSSIFHILFLIAFIPLLCVQLYEIIVVYSLFSMLQRTEYNLCESGIAARVLS